MKPDDYKALGDVAEMLARSGFFKDAQTRAQAFAKVLAGAELGLKPFAAMTALHVIEGKPCPSSNTYAAFIRRHPHYDYKVHETTTTACRIEFFRGEKDPKSGKLIEPESLGVLRLTLQDIPASLTGRATWKNYPQQMLFARTISTGSRTFCPDVFAGAVVYTQEEMREVQDLGTVRPVGPPEIGSDAELGQAEAQAASEGRDLSLEEPEWDVTPAPAKPVQPEVPRGPA